MVTTVHPRAPEVIVIDLMQRTLDDRPDGPGDGTAEPHIVALCSGAEHASALQAIHHGVRAVVHRDDPVGHIAMAIRAVAAGEAFLSPPPTRYLLEGVRIDRPGPRRRPVAASLSRRELEVIALLCDGVANPEIARRLSISATTVRPQIHHIATKFGLRDRTQVVVYVFRHGLAAPDPGEGPSVASVRPWLLRSTVS